MVKKYLLAAVAAGAFASPAMAQDAAFSGFRIEALGGYDSVGISVEDEDGEEASESKGGVLYGIGAGYDHAFGSLVIGAEAEVSDSTVGQDFEIDEEVEGYEVEGTGSLEATHDIYLGARVGARVSDGVLLYVKGGYSMATAKLEADGSVDGEDGTIKADLDLDGLRLGGGVEGQLGNNLFVKLEYRYTDYSDGEIEVEGTSVDIGEAFEYGGIDRHQVVFGIGYRF